MARNVKNRIASIREMLQDAWDYDRHNREEAEKDLLFRAGDQWPDDVRREREAAGRPCLTINKLGSMISQVTNDLRQNTPSIKARPVDNKSDPELAKIFNGIIRQIEEQSSARFIYSNAADHSISCGIGNFRITTAYLDDAAFDQEILIEGIPNPLSVLWDTASIKPDRSDAMHCFVIEKMPIKAFKKKYPKASTDSVDVSFNNDGSYLTFQTQDEILVAEFWEKIPVKRTLALFEGGETLDITDLDEFQMSLIPPPMDVREVDTHKVQMSLVNGNEVLEGPFEWAGKHIPIISIVGDEVPNGTQIIRSGMIRAARDPQTLYNYWRSQSAESIGQGTKSQWLVTHKHIKKNKNAWDNANKSPKPYLPYEYDENAPPPQKIDPPTPPNALWQEGALCSDDLKSTTGIHDASLGAKSNETSGKAILARQREGDTANYHFTDNLTRALEHAGRILIDLIPKIYDTERSIRILGEDDSEEFLEINKSVPSYNGEPALLNDLSAGRFDIKVTTGPSYTTKRIEAAESMMAFVQAFPQAGQIAGDLIASNMDWPGAEAISSRLKKMVPPEFLEGEDGEEQPPPQPDPMQQRMQEFQLESMQADITKKQAEAEGAQLDNIVKQVQLSMFE